MKTAALNPRQLVAQALQAYYGEVEPITLPDITLQISDQLTRVDIDYVVQLIKVCFNLPSGNSGGKDLYRLLVAYLTDAASTEQINTVIQVR